MKLSKVICLLFATCSLNSQAAAQTHEQFPKVIDSKSAYVFYTHGYIVEGNNAKPVHPRWGVYDFPAIKKQLADPSYQLIATHRPANADPFVYAKKLAKQVNSLIEQGVQPNQISLVGFSRGGFITALATSYLKNKELNIAILAACTSALGRNKEVVVYGNLLSIYETSDSVGSCNKVAERSGDNVKSYREIAISTGKEHGAFYRPIDEWLQPVRAWLQKNSF